MAVEEGISSKPLAEKTDSDVQREALRARNKVRPVENKEAGAGIAQLPNGVFGFTFSPQQEAPLFEHRMFGNFEVHKLADGAVHIIGFVTEKEYTQFSLSNDRAELKLYPDSYEESVKAVSVPVDRAAAITAPSRDDGNFIKLQINPASE